MEQHFQDTAQLLVNCKEESYIHSNMAAIKTHFTALQNITALKEALSTKNNFTALKVIKCLGLSVLPNVNLNSFTFVSLFWLNRMGVIQNPDFIAISRKFEILRNFDVLREETEKEFIALQIQKRRCTGIRRYPPLQQLQFSSFFNVCRTMSVFFNLDDVLDFEWYTFDFPDLKNRLFRTELRTFEDFRNDPLKNEKIYGFRAIRNSLTTCPVRSFSQFYKLGYKDKQKAEALMSAINKVKRCGMKYYVYSYKNLPTIMTFCYLFFNNIDLTKLLEIASPADLEFKIPGRRVIIGNEGLQGKNATDFLANLRQFCVKSGR